MSVKHCVDHQHECILEMIPRYGKSGCQKDSYFQCLIIKVGTSHQDDILDFIL